MDLFEYNRRGVLEREAPLASRMRPRTLDEVVGQEHIIGPDRLLSRAIRADRIGSLILYGPPGTGKTTIAQVIANTTHSRFVQINATTAGKKDMEDAVQKARDALGMEERRTILFVDEIQRGTPSAWRSAGPSSSWTRSTASTRRSRTTCSRSWRTAP